MEKTSTAPAASARAAARATRTRIGDLVYDVQHQALRHGERASSLTLSESKIVAYLFRNASRPVAAKELLRNALGSNARQKTTIVERHVCDIRRKLAATGAKTAIRTIRYRGYAVG